MTRKMKDTFIFGNEEMGMSIIPVMDIESPTKLRDNELPDMLPLLPLRGAVLFPDTIIPIPVRREKSLQLLDEVYNGSKLVGTVTQRDPRVEDPEEGDLFPVGTLGRIVKLIEIPGGPMTAIIQGIKRFSIKSVELTNPYLAASVTYLNDDLTQIGEPDMKIISDGIKDNAIRILKLTNHVSQEAISAVKDIDQIPFLINFVATTIDIDNPVDKIPLLEENSIKSRGIKLLALMDKQMEILKIKEEIQRKAKMEMDQQQREYYLNNQLKTIQEELGMSSSDDIYELREMDGLQESLAGRRGRVLREGTPETGADESLVARLYGSIFLRAVSARYAVGGDVDRQSRPASRPQSAGCRPLRAREGEGAHHRISGGPQVER